ncbi:YdcF family protein [Candidatus Woesearchaeota archaeon]|nr:YdcF family protein [Candidatus Woesearchaeota archaeon]
MEKDAIVILASGVKPDGSLPVMCRLRVEKGVELYKQGVAKNIIMSGKWGFVIDYKPLRTESSAMKEYAVKLGANEENVFVEEKSQDTIGNIFFTKKLFLEPNKWRKIVIITSKFHMPRTKYLCKKILGPDYEVDFNETKSDVSEKELKLRFKDEKKVMWFTKQIFNKVPDGNSEKIEKILFTEHPAYAKNPKISKYELLRMLQKSHHKASKQ